MEPNTKLFTHFFPKIENIPFSDKEACQLLNISSANFHRAIKLGLIRKSVDIHYRLGVFFNFTGILDLFEYALRRDLFFLSYGCNTEVSELVCSLVDEFASINDNCNYTSNSPQIDRIKKDIIDSCMDNSEKWEGYWLYDGDPFSSTKCSAIALQTWNKVIKKAMSLIGPPVIPPKNSSDGFSRSAQHIVDL